MAVRLAVTLSLYLSLMGVGGGGGVGGRRLEGWGPDREIMTVYPSYITFIKRFRA